MNLRMLRTFLVIIGLVILSACLFPKTTAALCAVFLICGIYDFCRHRIFTIDMFKRYFLGNGSSTWALSPLNTLFDLVTKPNPHILSRRDLSPECQSEIDEVIHMAKQNQQDIFAYLNQRMEEKKRGMIFFQWYGKNIKTDLEMPEFHQKFKFVKTIGISVFNENQSTGLHFGPLRLMFRVLYNMSPPLHHDGIYIEVKNKKYFWHDSPLFIFDDTLIHASYNKNNAKRYCLFIDILRPSTINTALKGILFCVGNIAFAFRRTFYKNWEFI